MPDSSRRFLAELRVPAQPAFIPVAKRVAASLGGQMGFSLEEIDDLSIAVSQACGSTIEAAEDMWGSGSELKLIYTATDRGIAVDVEAEMPAVARRGQPARMVPVVPNRELEVQRELARDMIRLFVDDFRHQVDTGRRRIRFRMVKYLIS